MNKNIELVKKWLADQESVTKEELLASREAAYAPTYAADAACAGYTEDAYYWVEHYEELNKVDKHIELVKKWLSDPDSVTQEELLTNSVAAKASVWAVNAVSYAACNDAANATYSINRYEELHK